MRRVSLKVLAAIVVLGVCSQGWALCKKKSAYEPLWAGSLLAASGKTIDAGHVGFEPYLFDQEVYGAYDSRWRRHSVPHLSARLGVLSLKLGVSENMDLIVRPRVQQNLTQKHLRTAMGDMVIGFGYQVMHGSEDSYKPDIRMIVEETLPSGKFKDLDLDDGGVGASGGGAYATTIGVAAQKVFVMGNGHPVRIRFNASISGSNSVRVKNSTMYGGGVGTKGTVYPGNLFRTILAGEYSITKNWVAALDIVYAHAGKTTFSGNPGMTPSGAVAKVGGPSSDQISLAPAIEYNFNKTVGIIGGVWFTVAGRNSAAFVSPTIAVYIYH